jgi:hypothetical protein
MYDFPIPLRGAFSLGGDARIALYCAVKERPLCQATR